jgi:hypothetical protein
LDPVVLRELLEGAPYEVLAILHCAAGVHPGQPRPQVLSVAVGQVGQLLGGPCSGRVRTRTPHPLRGAA